MHPNNINRTNEFRDSFTNERVIEPKKRSFLSDIFNHSVVVRTPSSKLIAIYLVFISAALIQKRNVPLPLKARSIEPAVTLLPAAVLGIIFSNLDAKHIFTARGVCKAWNQKLKHREFFDNLGHCLNSKHIALTLYTQYVMQHKAEDPYRWRFFKNLIKSTGIEIGILSSISCLSFLGAYALRNSYNERIEEFQRTPRETFQQDMEKYNNQIVVERFHHRRFIRPLHESEKYHSLDEYIQARLKSKLDEMDPKLFLCCLGASTACGVATMISNNWKTTKIATENQFWERLFYPKSLSTDAVLKDHVDPITGRVMVLPIQLQNGFIVDLMPISLRNAEYQEKTDFIFCIDKFRLIQRRIKHLKDTGTLPADVLIAHNWS